MMPITTALSTAESWNQRSLCYISSQVNYFLGGVEIMDT